MLLFLAYGYEDIGVVCRMIARTARWDAETIRGMLYVTMQHSAMVRTREEALRVLAQHVAAGPSSGRASSSSSRHASSSSSASSPGMGAVEDLLHANVLPHLADPGRKMLFLAHMIGALLNHMFDPDARNCMLYDKDFMGNKRVPRVQAGRQLRPAWTRTPEVCGNLMSQQVRSAICPGGCPEGRPSEGTACEASSSAMWPRT